MRSAWSMSSQKTMVLAEAVGGPQVLVMRSATSFVRSFSTRTRSMSRWL
jgi:hypothetical protein